ncbi:MAG: hypothetical protein Q7S96_04090 [bacterium]|nr:hypothetical protein [bacterium]
MGTHALKIAAQAERRANANPQTNVPPNMQLFLTLLAALVAFAVLKVVWRKVMGIIGHTPATRRAALEELIDSLNEESSTKDVGDGGSEAEAPR